MVHPINNAKGCCFLVLPQSGRDLQFDPTRSHYLDRSNSKSLGVGHQWGSLKTSQLRNVMRHPYRNARRRLRQSKLCSEWSCRAPFATKIWPIHFGSSLSITVARFLCFQSTCGANSTRPSVLVLLARNYCACVCAYPSLLWINLGNPFLTCFLSKRIGQCFRGKGTVWRCGEAAHLRQRAWEEQKLGTEKTLSIAMNHPKPSQEISEIFGPSIHKMKGFSRNLPPKVHPNFAQNLGRQILGNTFSGLIEEGIDVKDASLCRCKQEHGMSARRSVLLEEWSENAPKMLLNPCKNESFGLLVGRKRGLGLGGLQNVPKRGLFLVANVCRWWLSRFSSGRGSACHESHHYQDTKGSLSGRCWCTKTLFGHS